MAALEKAGDVNTFWKVLCNDRTSQIYIYASEISGLVPGGSCWVVGYFIESLLYFEGKSLDVRNKEDLVLHNSTIEI